MMEKLFGLKGKTLSTLARAKKFDVLKVDEKKILVVPQSTNFERPISKNRIEWAWNELRTKGELTQQEIFLSGTVNSAYIATILTQLLGVTYKTKPVRLYYNKPED